MKKSLISFVLAQVFALCFLQTNSYAVEANINVNNKSAHNKSKLKKVNKHAAVAHPASKPKVPPKTEELSTKVIEGSPTMVCFSTDDVKKFGKTVFVPPGPQSKASPSEPMSCPVREPITCPASGKVVEKVVEERVVEKIVEKGAKPYDTSVWMGYEGVYAVGDLSNYVPQFFSGYTFGVSQTLMHLDGTNDLYLAFNSDIANTAQTQKVKGEQLESVFYMINLQFLAGLEHFFNYRPLSVYADGGIEVMQKAFLIANPGGSTNSYSIFSSENLAINFGMNYVYKLNEKMGILTRLNVSTSVGLPKTQGVYSSSGEQLDSVDQNSIMVRPSLSFGLRF
ncbi:MAG: hypothetical protein V4591_02400 [Bdellovibrionota bacterium]